MNHGENFASRALRGRVLRYVGDPAALGPAARRYDEDGAILVRDGHVAAIGPAQEVLRGFAGPVDDLRPFLLLPGFVDAHLHAPQTQVIASPAHDLLDWLERYTFPEEAKSAHPAHALRLAEFLIAELVRNGTTTACVYSSAHLASAEAVFSVAERAGLRLIVGKTMMDRGAPPAILDTPRTGYDQSKALIARWHGRGRLSFAVTPRFAITSTQEQLEAAGALAAEHPECYVQTHLDESPREIARVAELFPDAEDYAHVYERVGLLGPRTLLGHCIHMTPRERERLSSSRSVAVFCPTSNLFLGSGVFDLDKAHDPAAPLRVALATDVGGGTSYSMLVTMREAYKALMARGRRLSADEAFHMATLGGAQALGLDDKIGALALGAEADVIALDCRATPAMAHRAETIESLEQELFLLMTMGDDRAVAATYVRGERAKR